MRILGCLVRLQSRLSARCYDGQHATTYLFVRPLSDAERKALEDGLRSSDAFGLRRSQILLASSRGENAYRIAHSLGCDSQTVRTAVKRFNDGGIEEALCKRSSRPKKIHMPPSRRGGPSDCARGFIEAPGSSARTQEPVDARLGHRGEL
jgi:Winged helix-turn helix